MKIIFAGTPEFAATHLQALLNSNHEIIAVYTQPDRPAGRGRQLTASPVKTLALQHNLPMMQPKTLRDEIEQKKLAELNADLMIVVAYGLILPQVVLQTPRFGCFNVHASLLPRWRGAAPIQHAILAGDHETGVTIMQMDVGLDTGDMLYKITCPILNTDTGETLHDRLAEIGPQALLHTLDLLNNKQLSPEKQDDTLTCYAHKLEKAQADILWEKEAIEIDRMIRAFNSWPIAFSHYQNQVIRIWQASVINENTNATPGTILKISTNGIDIACGKNILRLEKIQLAGGRPLMVADILRGHANMFTAGEKLTHA